MSYFYYVVSCRQSDEDWIRSQWYDEHIIGKVPIGGRSQIRCDEVSLGLQKTDGSICMLTDLVGEGGRYDLWRVATLAIEGAEAGDYDSESHVPWDVIADLGEPDEVTYITMGPGEYPETYQVLGIKF